VTVELLIADLELDDARYAEALATLSPRERERLRRLRSPLARRRFAARRSTLRKHLGNLLDVEPAAVAFAEGRHGKPQLSGHDPGIRFNSADCEQVAIVAFSSRADVGVDVELVDPRRRWRPLLRRICAPPEAAEAERESRRCGEGAFFRRWVAKEAVLKALGCGLTVSPVRIPLHSTDDRLETTLPRVTLEVEPPGVPVPPGFVAAIARLDPA
jgi:4'-phosphopantetheinyl transferase